MAHTLSIECTYTIAGHTYRLRPALLVLHTIEMQTGFTMREMAHSCTHKQAKIIIQAATDDAPEEEDALCEVAKAFLAHALQDISAFNWRDMFTLYVGMMGRPTAEFWNITPAEYLLAVEGFCQLRGIAPEAAGMPATSHDLAEMVRRFGDDV